MRKFYTTLFTLAAAASLSVNAQQLPNAGFEGAWNTCTPWTAGKGNKTIGQNPDNWCISHVMGVSTGLFAGQGKKAMGSEIAGFESAKAVQVKNDETGALGITRNVPGYVTTGTTWSTAEGTKSATHDGGTWGGISFTGRPDAVELMYRRSFGGTDTAEPCSFIAYLWKGNTTMELVPVTITSGSAIKDSDKVTMTNRERNILDMACTIGGTVNKSADFELIAKMIVTKAGAQADWARLELPIEYLSQSTPEMLNVIFAANEYFNAAPATKGNTLDIDNVKLIYYSRLASLSVNGTALEGFASDNYTYTVNSEMPEESAFACTTMGNSGSAKATVTLDKDNAVATITVTNTNQGGTDVDGEASHVYTIQFNKTQAPEPTEPEGTKYTGSLNIKIEMLGIDVTQPDKVYIKDNGDGTCTFLLPDFTLTLPDMEPANFGDIKVDNVTVTTNADGSKSYSGSVTGMSLAEGEIIADVTISGTEKDGDLVMNISVIWEGIPIEVTFSNVVEKPEPEGTKYTGTLNIKIEMLGIDVTQPDKVYINDNGDGTCTFLLPDFTLTLPDMEPANFGDIKVDNVTVTTNADGSKSYSGSVTGMSLAEGEIIADVTISGTEKDGILIMNISVMWEGIPIDVTFTNGSSSIDDITADNENAPVEYYNLQGVRVNGDNLTPGIYIVRKGTEVSKIYVR